VIIKNRVQVPKPWVVILRDFTGKLSLSRYQYATEDEAKNGFVPTYQKIVGVSKIELEEQKNGCGCK
jgi:hypothetical protein